MNIIKSNVKTMTLKEITDLLDVQHSKAMLKVDRMAKDPEFGTVSILDVVYNDKGQKVKTYILDKRQSMAVSAVLNTTLLMRVIDRWQELESNQAPALPQSFAEALQLAADQAKQLEIAAPKIEFHDTVVNNTDTFSTRDAAKKINQRPIKFGEWLKGNGYLCLNGRAAQQYIDQGLFVTHTGVSDSNHAYTQTRMTSKGCAYFANKLFEIKL